MKKVSRRKFITTTAAAAAGAFAAPYILPSGRLFAATGARKANHVVFVLFAGGVRNIDSVQQSAVLNQGLPGNLMPNTLSGASVAIPGLDPLPAPNPTPLQNSGTLFKEFRYVQGPTGHFNGHTVAVTGIYTDTGLNLKEHPDYPTVFEYYRKHNSPLNNALNCWWVSNTLGPYPALNYSKYSGYGAGYGANYIAPTFLIEQEGFNVLGDMKVFASSEETAAGNMRNFLDKNFKQSATASSGVTNPPADAAVLQTFINDLFTKWQSGGFINPLGVSDQYANNDIRNVMFAEEIISRFKPELLVVNMQDVDVCHTDFTNYCDNLRKADHALAHLWNFIQSTPGMANDTILIAAPEHGRNGTTNSVQDNYGNPAIDHTGDDTSREIFSLVLGPATAVKQNQVLGTSSAPLGESTEIVPVIANILGFDTSIPPGIGPAESKFKTFVECDMQQAFV